MSTRPELPPVVPGRSALPAFLEVEAWVEARLTGARKEAESRLARARAQAEALETASRERLREAVLEGEEEALRDVERQAVDRTSAARREVEAWVRRSEFSLDAIVAEALGLLTAGPKGWVEPASAQEPTPKDDPDATSAPSDEGVDG